ncbi:GNAT family N-acetyltransferase [Demequina globuliformis]|uniref:GNAT family N-acetyltransferase n=1 Tax=Demequina globuliformis TaxID=676202 RepID=UPI0007830855|nr:GNAT family protein [Demequina globuliformis]
MSESNPRLTTLWPAAALRVTAGDLELRWMDDALLARVAEVAGRGVHAPEVMPFYRPWTTGTPEEVARAVLTFQWAQRAHVSPARLVLELGVLWRGEPVGIQGASGGQWGIKREVETGSWLGAEFHGRGIGTRMRIMYLALMFDHLDANYVTSAAFQDNPSSNAVSRKAGYEPDGLLHDVRADKPAMLNRWRMSRERWAQVRDHDLGLLGGDLVVEGAQPVKAQLASVQADAHGLPD